MEIRIVEAYRNQEEVVQLIREYIHLLLEEAPSFQHYLEVQNYEEELQNLEQKYGLPDGRLYLVYFQEKVAGCIALRKMNNCDCEMKRLYIKKEFRGSNIGDMLVKKIIEEARKIGYSSMFLDTLPFMKSAIALYEKQGFYRIPRYNNSPDSSAVYMKLEL